MTAGAERVPRAGLGPTRADVIAHLRSADGPLPVAAIAQAVGLHPNSARFHLDALVEQGLAVREPELRNRPGRPRLLYRADPNQPSEAAVLQDLAGALVRHLDRLGSSSVDQAEAAGHAWGEELAAAHPGPPLARTLATLTQLGYQPTIEDGAPDTIVLIPCPLGGLLTGGVTPGELPSVCRLHLGLVRGLLADDPDYTVGELHAFTTPDRCVVRLMRRERD